MTPRTELFSLSLFMLLEPGFANWHRKAIHVVMLALCRIREAVCFVARSPEGYLLFDSREGDANKLQMIARSTEFRDQNDDLAAVIRKLGNVSSWIRGCQCHEEESLRPNRKRFKCPFKGCRAKALADKLADIVSSTVALRASLPNFGSVPMQYVALALAMVI